VAEKMARNGLTANKLVCDLMDKLKIESKEEIDRKEIA